MDFHIHLILVNASLAVLCIPTFAPIPRDDEQAILHDGQSVAGRLEFVDGAMLFRNPDRDQPLPAGAVRKIVRTDAAAIPRGASPLHRVSLWGDESLSGTIEKIDDATVTLRTGAGDAVRVPLYLVAKIEHFQGEIVVLRDGFEEGEAALAMRKLGGEARATDDQVASGRTSLRLRDPGDSVEYKLTEPVGAGWFESRFFDTGGVHAKADWHCELEFDSPAGPRRLQVLLGWADESYGIVTPQGPALPVKPVARRAGWRRLGVRFTANRTTVLVDDAVLSHADVAIGRLQAIRFAVTAGDKDAADAPTAFIDDVQLAESVGAAFERQPSADQDDVLLANGDQIYGSVESATPRDVTLATDFGPYSVVWRQIQAVHFTSRPVPSKLTSGQRMRVLTSPAPGPARGQEANDAIEGVITAVNDDSIRIEHTHIGAMAFPRGQVREIELLPAGRWLSIDAGYHHFGNHLKPKFPVPYPEGTERSWRFELDEVPDSASLVLQVVDLEAMAPGAKFFDELKNGELRTMLELNGRELDPLDLNHLVPPTSRGPVRVRIALAAGALRRGENELRLVQTPQKVEPPSYDDCGIFGIGLELPGRPTR